MIFGLIVACEIGFWLCLAAGGRVGAAIAAATVPEERATRGSQPRGAS